jgi:hypothetical protein
MSASGWRYTDKEYRDREKRERERDSKFSRMDRAKKDAK